MASSAWTVTARKAFLCEAYRCPRAVQVGEEYVRHVAFPGDEVNGAAVPYVLRICQHCQTEHGQPMPRRRSKRVPSGGDSDG